MPARATSPANSEWGQKPDAPLARLVSDPNRSRLNSVVTRLLTGLCCLAVAANAAAQPPGESAAGPGGWRSLRVPGGVAPLLKAAGLTRACRARALRDVIHVIYDTQPGVNDAFDAGRVITYLESISAVEALGLERDRRRRASARPKTGRFAGGSRPSPKRSDARSNGSHAPIGCSPIRVNGRPGGGPTWPAPASMSTRSSRPRTRGSPSRSRSRRTMRPCPWLRKPGRRS